MKSLDIITQVNRYFKLAKASSSQIILSFDEVNKQIINYLNELADWSQSKGSSNYSPEQAKEDAEYLLSEIKKQMEKVASDVRSAISEIDGWNGSPITIKPFLPANLSDHLYDDNGNVKQFSASVYVGSGQVEFTLFVEDGKYMVEDVLEPGQDEEGFFQSKTEEVDYYKLINELRNPGQSKTDGEKVITVYTARPREDRSLYQGASEIPSNIFVSSSFQEAQGYALEFGGERDIYRIRVKKKYLMETLNMGGLKNYQVWDPSGKVPIVGISLL